MFAYMEHGSNTETPLAAPPTYVIPNLKKGIEVLMLLSAHHDGLRLKDISEQLDIPKTTALRILSTFCSEGMSIKTGDRYAPGFKLIQLGMRTLCGMELRKAATLPLQELSRKTGETAHLAVLSENKSLILDVCDSPNPLRIASRAGTQVPLYCSSTGKVFIAFVLCGPDVEAFTHNEPLERRAPHTLTSQSALKKEIVKIRAQGYALDDEEFFENVRCLAAPVRDGRGAVVAALGITAATVRFKKDQVAKVAASVLAAAADIARNLGAS